MHEPTLLRSSEPPRFVDRLPASWYRAQAVRRRWDLVRRLAGQLLGLVLLAAAASSCGPIEYLSQVSNRATSAVAAAKAANAERYAPYEYTCAVEYLHKAREEAAYAQYQDAIEYGRKSEAMANRARAMAMARPSASK